MKRFSAVSSAATGSGRMQMDGAFEVNKTIVMGHGYNTADIIIVTRALDAKRIQFGTVEWYLQSESRVTNATIIL